MDRLDELTALVLHERASEPERTELALLLERSADARRRFVRHAILDGMLADAGEGGAFAPDEERFFRVLENPTSHGVKRPLRTMAPVAALLVFVLGGLGLLLPVGTASALERLRVALEQELDRTYRIEVLDTFVEDTDPPRVDRGRYSVGAHLDGATLWLRGPQRFVLEQHLPNGETRTIGSDGREAWSVRGNGPVRVSFETGRFGGSVLEKRRELAFLDLRQQVLNLERSYALEWVERADSDSLSRVRGTRRSEVRGGPRDIELWFDDDGITHRMVLRRLPRGNGGPRSVSIELVSCTPLPTDFFQHHAHHEPNRPILREPRR